MDRDCRRRRRRVALGVSQREATPAELDAVGMAGGCAMQAVHEADAGGLERAQRAGGAPAVLTIGVEGAVDNCHGGSRRRGVEVPLVKIVNHCPEMVCRMNRRCFRALGTHLAFPPPPPGIRVVSCRLENWQTVPGARHQNLALPD